MIEWLEREMFRKSLTNPVVFKNFVRRVAYGLAGGDPEKVHEMALEALREYSDVVKEVSGNFDFPNLHVDVCGKDVMPFGPAEGLDKNGVALNSLAEIFGFVPWGTCVVPQRDGNKRPRVAMDEKNEIGYNAQGFPHLGLDAAEDKVKEYSGLKSLLSSVCGIPPSPEKIDVAYGELEILTARLAPYSDGIIWNPFSPNTDALKLLRTKEVFTKSAGLVRKIIGDKLLLVKMGPYDDNSEKRNEWLSLAEAFLEGGGDGIVAVNTYMIPKEQVPSKDWGYPVAGASGKFLPDYRQRAITDFRQAFGKKPFLIGVGGIDSAEEAFAAFEAGANVLAAYTPYIFNGFGLLPQIAKGVEKKLQERGYKTLREFQKDKGLVAVS